MMWSHVAVATAILGLCAACGDPEPEAPDATASLTVDQVIDFTTGYHAADPFHYDEDPDPLTDCAWETAQDALDAWGPGAAALFHCTGDAGDEDGTYPVVVSDYGSPTAAQEGIEDQLLPTGAFLFVEDSIVVDSYSVADESVRQFYEALIEDCDCGEILVIGED